MKTQTILDKFEAVSTTIDVISKENGDYITFNVFGVVPVRCDIRFFGMVKKRLLKINSMWIRLYWIQVMIVSLLN